MSRKIMTDDEKRIHREAIKLRKMTDTQLVEYVEKAESAKNTDDIGKFISEISGLHGIGSATLMKIEGFAKEKGYI